MCFVDRSWAFPPPTATQPDLLVQFAAARALCWPGFQTWYALALALLQLGRGTSAVFAALHRSLEWLAGLSVRLQCDAAGPLANEWRTAAVLDASPEEVQADFLRTPEAL